MPRAPSSDSGSTMLHTAPPTSRKDAQGSHILVSMVPGGVLRHLGCSFRGVGKWAPVIRGFLCLSLGPAPCALFPVDLLGRHQGSLCVRDLLRSLQVWLFWLNQLSLGRCWLIQSLCRKGGTSPTPGTLLRCRVRPLPRRPHS